jgi:hypothetical protein
VRRWFEDELEGQRVPNPTVARRRIARAAEVPVGTEKRR